MANVLFKRGEQASLNFDATTYIDGCFYLTTDTHRLYVGTDTGKIVPVNEGILTVDKVADLSSVGASGQAQAGNFYYATTENVLCVYNGKQWVQINPDTDTTIKEIKISTSLSGNKASVKVIPVDNNNKEVPTVAPFTVEGALDGDDLKTVEVTNTTTGVKITGDTYTLDDIIDTDNDTYEIDLTSTFGHDSSIKMKAGKYIQFNKDATDGALIIQGEPSTKVTKAEIRNGDSPVNNKTVTNKGFHIHVEDSTGAKVEGDFDPVISINSKGYEFENGVVTLDVYDKGQIDNLFKTLNPMVYRGVTNGSLPSGDIHIGDTWIVSGTALKGTVSAKVGDMIIASAKSGATETNGVLASGDIEWTVVPSGDDSFTDTQFELINGTHGVVLKNDKGAEKGGFFVAAGADGMVTLTDSTNTDGQRVTTIGHANVTKTTENITSTQDSSVAMAKLATDFKVTAVTGVETNNQGHVTKVITKEFKIQDTNGSITEVAVTPTVTSNVATVETAVTFKNANGAGSPIKDSFKIASDNLTLSQGTDSVKMNFEWGSF